MKNTAAQLTEQARRTYLCTLEEMERAGNRLRLAEHTAEQAKRDCENACQNYADALQTEIDEAEEAARIEANLVR